MYRRLLLLAAMILVVSEGQSQERKRTPPPYSVTVDHATEGAVTISKIDLQRHLITLASDEMQGRELGTEGNKMAAQYIASVFEKMGLQKVGDDNSYFQKVPFHQTSWETLKLSANGKEYELMKDYVSIARDNNDLQPLISEEVVFLGYGIDDAKYSDYKKDVTGKVILIYKGEPIDANGNSWLTGTKETSNWAKNPEMKFKKAKEKGVKAVLLIEDEILKQFAQYRNFLLRPSLQLGFAKEVELANHFYISTDLAKDIIGDKFAKIVKTRDKIQQKGKSKAVKLKTEIGLVQLRKVEDLEHENVLGYVEGTDPNLKEEVLVVTAHYDHVGMRGEEIFNGADDNASGTSTVLEIAEAFADLRKREVGPKRSILFMLVTGEEKGLLGSKFYVENPVFPLEKTIANINIDMVGRVDPKHEENPNYIYVIGSNRLSTELHDINEEMNEMYSQIELDYTYNAEDDPNRFYYRSDHYNFAKNGIPAIFYFNGTHADYHRATDTEEKINYDKMEKIARLVYYTTWELTTRDKRIQVDVTGGK